MGVEEGRELCGEGCRECGESEEGGIGGEGEEGVWQVGRAWTDTTGAHAITCAHGAM